MGPSPALAHAPLPPWFEVIPSQCPLCRCIPQCLVPPMLPRFASQVRGRQQPCAKVQLHGRLSVEQRFDRRKPGAPRWCSASCPACAGNGSCHGSASLAAWMGAWLYKSITVVPIAPARTVPKSIAVQCMGCSMFSCSRPHAPPPRSARRAVSLQFVVAVGCAVSGKLCTVGGTQRVH